MAFLEEVELWLPAEVERVYAIIDNLSTHRATDVLLFLLTHPRWEMVFQPKYAAYLNLIEPCWKMLRSLALKGRRFESWEEIAQAVERATAYWDDHRHPFVRAGGADPSHAASPGSLCRQKRPDLPDEPVRTVGIRCATTPLAGQVGSA